MANIARDIFKAYDIRGIVGKTLTDEAAYLIGKAIATKASEKGITRIALGRDGRLSGPSLMAQIQRVLQTAASTSSTSVWLPLLCSTSQPSTNAAAAA